MGSANRNVLLLAGCHICIAFKHQIGVARGPQVPHFTLSPSPHRLVSPKFTSISQNRVPHRPRTCDFNNFSTACQCPHLRSGNNDMCWKSILFSFFKTTNPLLIRIRMFFCRSSVLPDISHFVSPGWRGVHKFWLVCLAHQISSEICNKSFQGCISL